MVDPSRDLYSVDTIIFFLRNYDDKSPGMSYNEYMDKALALNKHLVRVTDAYSIFKFFDMNENMLKREVRFNNNQASHVNFEDVPAEAVEDMDFAGYQHVQSELQESPHFKAYLIQSVKAIQEK